jgi:hypothetical protein
MSAATLEDRVARLETWARGFGGGVTRPAAAPAAAPRPATSAASTEVASDTDLDSPHGDPEVRRDPPRWDGPSFKGRHFSQTSPEYLDDLAGFLDWRASKEEEEPDKKQYAKYSRLDAKRARGWAARLRGRPATQAAAASAPHADAFEGGAFSEGEDDIPF